MLASDVEIMFPFHASHELAIQYGIAGKLSPDSTLQSLQMKIFAL